MLNSKYIASRIRSKNRRVINQLNRGSKPALDSESIPGEVADILVVDRVGRSGSRSSITAVAELASHFIKNNDYLSHCPEVKGNTKDFWAVVKTVIIPLGSQEFGWLVRKGEKVRYSYCGTPTEHRVTPPPPRGAPWYRIYG